MLRNKSSNKNTKVKKNQNQVNEVDNNANSNNYSWDAEVIHGNAATGEQVWVKREVRSDNPITYEAMQNNWRDMDREAEKLKKDYPGQVISAISYQDEVGNQVVRFTPTTELIFPVGVPIYDENGNKIVGLDNIRAEVARRREEWAKWEREGKLSEHVEIHHTDDGKTVRIKFRAAPKRLHPNEIKGETEWFINNETQRWENQQNQFGIGNSQELSKETSNVLTDDGNKHKKLRTGEKGSSIPMEVDDKAENCASEPIIKMLTDDEIKISSNDEITNLIERLNKELESRKKGEATSSIFQEFSTAELENKMSKAKNALILQTSNNNATANNDDDKGSDVGGIVAVVSVVSAFVIGSVVLVKSKLDKNKRK